eukprot:763829-Hanusia_phi.AAC.2
MPEAQTRNFRKIIRPGRRAKNIITGPHGPARRHCRLLSCVTPHFGDGHCGKRLGRALPSSHINHFTAPLSRTLGAAGRRSLRRTRRTEIGWGRAGGSECVTNTEIEIESWTQTDRTPPRLRDVAHHPSPACQAGRSVRSEPLSHPGSRPWLPNLNFKSEVRRTETSNFEVKPTFRVNMM